MACQYTAWWRTRNGKTPQKENKKMKKKTHILNVTGLVMQNKHVKSCQSSLKPFSGHLSVLRAALHAELVPFFHRNAAVDGVEDGITIIPVPK